MGWGRGIEGVPVASELVHLFLGVARAVVIVDQNLVSEMYAHQEKITQEKSLPLLAYWLSFTGSGRYSFRPD